MSGRNTGSGTITFHLSALHWEWLLIRAWVFCLPSSSLAGTSTCHWTCECNLNWNLLQRPGKSTSLSCLLHYGTCKTMYTGHWCPVTKQRNVTMTRNGGRWHSTGVTFGMDEKSFMFWCLHIAKLAPLYNGPDRVDQVIPDMNYKLSDVSDNSDTGVHHVSEILPFFTLGGYAQSSHNPLPTAACRHGI